MSKKGEVSQTIEESNKLRESLGIKPLKEDARQTTKGSSNDPMHVAPVTTGTKKGEDSKSKAAAKKARDAHKELVAGKGLGDILADEGAGSASDWVAKSRTDQGAMKAPAKSAASGSGKKRPASEMEGLGGIKVRHDAASLQEGETVVMTLSDQQMMDKDGNLIDAPDELSNVRLSDAERAKHHNALKKQVDYDPDKDGQDILDKYNELKEKPEGFVIGGRNVGGAIQETDPEKKLAILTALGEKHSLDNKLKIQTDYYTAEEMSKMWKPKKKTKRRKTEKVDKDDAIGDPTKVGGGAAAEKEYLSDEEDPELYEQLNKQRRLVKKSADTTTKKGEAALAAVTEQIAELANEDEEKKEEREQAILGAKAQEAESIALTATTEFCNVVQTPLEKIDTLKHESFRGSSLYKQQVASRKGVVAGERKARKAGTAPTPEELAVADRGEADIEQLKEHELDMTAASGLAYLRARAQIGNDQESHKFKKRDNRPLEMSTSDGDIKLEYRDDFGRVQTPKEAFRAISWKFHGKTPGRKNLERRLLRLENEMKLKTMDAMTQLPTLRALRHVQSADAKPYMVLSGANEK